MCVQTPTVRDLLSPNNRVRLRCAPQREELGTPNPTRHGEHYLNQESMIGLGPIIRRITQICLIADQARVLIICKPAGLVTVMGMLSVVTMNGQLFDGQCRNPDQAWPTPVRLWPSANLACAKKSHHHPWSRYKSANSLSWEPPVRTSDIPAGATTKPGHTFTLHTRTYGQRLL